MTLIIVLLVTGLFAGLFLLITKPYHDRREKEFQNILTDYLDYLDNPRRHRERKEQEAEKTT